MPALIVRLGRTRAEYAAPRDEIGFRRVDEPARRHGLEEVRGSCRR